MAHKNFLLLITMLLFITACAQQAEMNRTRRSSKETSQPIKLAAASQGAQDSDGQIKNSGGSAEDGKPAKFGSDQNLAPTPVKTPIAVNAMPKRHFRMGLWYASIDADVGFFNETQPQPDGYSVLQLNWLYDNWKNGADFGAFWATFAKTHDLSRIEALVIDEPIWGFSPGNTTNPCSNPGDPRMQLVDNYLRRISDIAGTLRKTAPKVRLWVNFAEFEVQWMGAPIPTDELSPSLQPANCNLALNTADIDVVSVDVYLRLFKDVKPYYDFFLNHRPNASQQIALVPGVFFNAGPAATDSKSTDPAYVVSVMKDFFYYANVMNHNCATLGYGVRGNSSGQCPVWLMAGWFAGSGREDIGKRVDFFPAGTPAPMPSPDDGPNIKYWYGETVSSAIQQKWQEMLSRPVGRFFVVGGSAYYADGNDLYCSITSEQWTAAGVSTPASYSTVPNGLTFRGPCQMPTGAISPDDGSVPLPAGFFWTGSGGYYANSIGHYCGLMNPDHWQLSGGASDSPYFPTISYSMVNDGDCSLPAGFFWNGGSGYYANSNGHYCGISSLAHWAASGAPDNAPIFPRIPNSMVNDGDCSLPAGFFWNGGSGYYANSDAHYCRITDAWIAAKGPLPSSAPNFPRIPSSMIKDNDCPY